MVFLLFTPTHTLKLTLFAAATNTNTINNN